MKFVSHHLLAGLGLLISAVALFWLARQFNLAELASSLSLLDPMPLVPVPLLIVVSFCLRTQRWRLLVEHQPPIRYWSSFSALMIGYLFNNLLPARAGDVARALELGRTEQISRTKVFATLVTERAVDLVATLAVTGLVLLSYPALPSWLRNSGSAVALLAGCLVAVLLLMHTTGRHWLPSLVRLFAGKLPRAVGDKIGQMAISALDGIAGMFRPMRAVGFLVLTALIWIIEVSIVYLVATSFSLALPLGNALFVLLVLAIGSMVPSSPGFVGTYEFFGISALAMVGIQGGPALAFIVLLHLATLLGSTLIGVACLWVRPRLVPVFTAVSHDEID